MFRTNDPALVLGFGHLTCVIPLVIPLRFFAGWARSFFDLLAEFIGRFWLLGPEKFVDEAFQGTPSRPKSLF